MLEVIPESLHETTQAPAGITSVVTELGPIRLLGEIVDSKCYLGVMNPGSGKVHRDCAARCISGGAPPALVAQDAAGETQVLLHVGSDSRALNKEILSFVARTSGNPGEACSVGFESRLESRTS
jgi:hypothetical protein